MAQGEKRPVVMEAAKGVPGGVASLGADGKVPQEQLPEFGISNAEIKQKLVDDDCLAITDSEANNRTKRVFWSNIKEILGGLFVPVTRKINKKALSSDVTLTGADIKVSSSDETSVSTALSNKADGADHKIKTYTAYTDLGLSGDAITVAQIFTALPIGSTLYTNNAPTSCLGADFRPSNDIYGLLLARKITDNSMLLEWHSPLNYDGTIAGDYTSAYRSVSTTPWSGWAQVATAEPPQEYTLQAQSGLTANVQYSRSQEGIVVLYADVRKSDSSALGASAITVGTLPVGFRPASTVYASAVALDSSAGAILGAAQIWVSQTGVISMIADPQSGAHRVRGELVFPVG